MEGVIWLVVVVSALGGWGWLNWKLGYEEGYRKGHVAGYSKGRKDTRA